MSVYTARIRKELETLDREALPTSRVEAWMTSSGADLAALDSEEFAAIVAMASVATMDATQEENAALAESFGFSEAE